MSKPYKILAEKYELIVEKRKRKRRSRYRGYGYGLGFYGGFGGNYGGYGTDGGGGDGGDGGGGGGESVDPFKDEPRNVYGDTEGLEPGETGMPHGHGYPNTNEDYDKVVRIDYISTPDADDDSNVEDQSNYPLFVTLYDTARNLGGHEEGGWWYNVTTKVKSFMVISYQQAEKAAKVLYNEINQGDLDGKPTIRLERKPGIMDNSKQPPPHYS
jgi:hypothetical protein